MVDSHVLRLTWAHPCASAVASAPADAAPPPPSMGGLADTYAVVDIGGVQHIVEEGRWYTCNRIDVRICSCLFPATAAAGRHTCTPGGRPLVLCLSFSTAWRHARTVRL